MWQVTDQGRTVCETLLVSYSVDNKLLNFLPPPEKINPALAVYFYVEEQEVIFKGLLEKVTPAAVSVSFPAEIRLLDEEDEIASFRKNNRISTRWSNKSSMAADKIQDFIVVKSMKDRTSRDQDFLTNEFKVSLDEEEKMFADKRESPRLRPKVEKLVKVVKKGESKIHVQKLFDLSQGGFAFLTLNPAEFEKGCEVFVMGFDAFDLDDPLIGKVMSHRAMDELNVEFKIGVKFDEGQA
jgi:hypothetical protein